LILNAKISPQAAIFGAGKSGQAARRLALAQGFDVVLFDEAGHGERDVFAETDVERFDRFVFSPGFAPSHPWRRLAVRSGKPCQSEVAFAAPCWKGRLIGVTGTNGKTTLTQLLANAFREAGHDSIAAGNIGFPLSDAVLQETANHGSSYAVCEISSFQAELTEGLGLDGLLWTNFAEDHLDRYGTMEAYFNAKAELFRSLKPDRPCVVGPDLVPWFERFGRPIDKAVVATAQTDNLEALSDQSVFRRPPQSNNFILAEHFWKLIGSHHEALIRSADSFVLAPHRLSVIAEKGGVRFWDDSKATNFHATLAALEAVDGPVVWIGGGQAKGGDLEAFGRAVAGRVEAAVLYGEVAPRLERAMADVLFSVDHRALFEDAVVRAYEIARRIGRSSVLLSPGFSSFDQFDSYAGRGKSFKSIVLGL
jgi:UDP-N-acetylmuramoylalanine--D-glutamate ligase